MKEGWVHREESQRNRSAKPAVQLSSSTLLRLLMALQCRPLLEAPFLWPLDATAICLSSSSPSFAPSMPFSNAGSLQSHSSSKVAFPLIALQWPHLLLLLQSLSSWFSVLHFGPTSLSWVSGPLPHLSIVVLHLEVSKTPLDQIHSISISYFSKWNHHSRNCPKGKKKKKPWFSTWLITFTANKNPFHFYLKRCPTSSHTSSLPLLKSPCHVCALSCPTLCDPTNCSPPSSSAHGISQARILEWVDIPFSREPSWPRDWTCVSLGLCIGRFSISAPLKLRPL